MEAGSPVVSSVSVRNEIQDWIGILCAVGMIFGFAASRAVLSISMILLAANVFWPLQLKEVWTRFLSNKFGLFAFLYFLIVFIGGIWSSRQDMWFDITILHLPFMILPLAMHTIPLHKRRFRIIFIICLYAILLAVIAVSLCTFLANLEYYRSAYAHSKVIPTISENDHIRFSLCLSLSILPGISFLYDERSESVSRLIRRFIRVSIAVIIVYIHILSAKTGLMALYLVLGLVLFYYFRRKGFRSKAVILPPVAILLIIVFGYFIIPTFQAKVDYVLHELVLISSGQPLDYNYSDAGRLISYQIALQAFQEQPFFGVGTGDVMQCMHSGYEIVYPDIPVENHLIPHSQFIYTLLAYGIIFYPVFIGMVISPFFARIKKSQFFLTATTIVLICGMLVEAMLQVQLGVFVYLYFTGIWFTWMQDSREEHTYAD